MEGLDGDGMGDVVDYGVVGVEFVVDGRVGYVGGVVDCVDCGGDVDGEVVEVVEGEIERGEVVIGDVWVWVEGGGCCGGVLGVGGWGGVGEGVGLVLGFGYVVVERVMYDVSSG